MNLSDFIDALNDAFHPRCKRNRRRLHNRWAEGFVKVVAVVWTTIRSVPFCCSCFFRLLVPAPHERGRRHISGRRGVKHRRRKVIRIDDSNLMRVDLR